MDDLSITAGNVVAATGSSVVPGTAGEAITAGQVVYKNTSTGKYMLADVDDSEKYAAEGIALNGASNGQPLDVCSSSSDLDIGATLTVGTVYVLSADGAISPAADLTTGDYAVVIGVATATDSLKVSIGSNNRADSTIA